MKRLLSLLCIACLLTSCLQPRGMTTYHPSVNRTGYKAHRTLQEKLNASFGRNMKGPNRFKRRHF